MSHLTISMFGCFQVFLDGQQAMFPTEKARALLAYLVLESGRSFRRESLSSLLWPDCSATAARNSLRQTIYRLRNTLDDQGVRKPYLLIDLHEIQFNRAADYWLDATEFASLFSIYRSHHWDGAPLCEACRERLVAAVALFQDDLLAGFSLPGCTDFSWWLLAKQESYRLRMLEALRCLGAHYERVEDYELAADFTTREIMIEPWTESAHRRQMRILMKNAQRCAALDHFEQFRDMLVNELGGEPSPRTTNLYEQIRDGTFADYARQMDH